jgi:hypothetical protein
MKLLRILFMTMSLGATAMAAEPQFQAESVRVMGSSMTTAAGMSSSSSATVAKLPLQEKHQRTFILVIGIAAVAVTFHRAFATRRSAS